MSIFALILFYNLMCQLCELMAKLSRILPKRNVT